MRHKNQNSSPGFVLRQGAATAAICAKQRLDGGFATPAAAEYVLKLVQFSLFVLIWKGLAKAGVPLGGMSEQTLLTYTLLSFILHRQLNVLTTATSSLWEGSLAGRYTRPMPLYVSFFSETVGKQWVPYLLFFSLPVLAVAAFMGVSPLPATPARGLLFIPSLLLSIMVGYALDILFAAFAMSLKNAPFIALRIREAAHSTLSGALIPFALMPRPVAAVLEVLPFGSVASAPLLIYTGGGSPLRLLLLQLFWAAALWAAAHAAYKKSEEKVVSYGG